MQGEALLLPTFFVIGASKCGTTSLHHYLDTHPGVEMTHPKEPHLFCGPEPYRERLFYYAELFRGRASVRGEASPGYATLPANHEVPKRIRECVPAARLVYLVRDPVERAIAHYAEHVIQRLEERPVEVALDPEDETGVYLAASRYATQIEAYLEHFPAERLLVADSGELRDRRRVTLDRIFAHVGAEPGFWDPSFETEHYTRSDANTRRTRAELALRQSRVYRRFLRPVFPERARIAVRQATRRVFGRTVEPSVDSELRADLEAVLAPEADRLRRLTGQAFAGWSV